MNLKHKGLLNNVHLHIFTKEGIPTWGLGAPKNKLPQSIGIPDWQPMHKTKFKTGKHKFRDGAKSRATKRKTHINKQV